MRQPGAAAARAGGELLRPLSGRPTPRTVALDLLLWAVLCVPVLMGLAAALDGVESAVVESPLDAAATMALLAAAVALSRPYPLAAAVLALVVAELMAPGAAFAVTVLCYLLGRRDARVWPAAAACAAGAVWLSAVVIAAPELALDVPGMLITYVFSIVLPWMVGSYRRQRRNLDEAGWERARRLEREQRIAAEEARLRERSRIAQDMHDSLGHELSLIALRAGALELASDMAERHRAAAGELRESATAATERLREIVGVLRESGQAAPTAPAGEGIAEVVERARRSGVDVVLERSGTWEGIAPMVDRAAYRVVQEGLTNATRHAPGAPVRIRLERPAGEVAVTVSNGAPRWEPSRGRDAAGGGSGLIGLGERVRLAGGTLEAGERGEGFAVTARFPAEGARAAAPGAEEAGGPPAADEHRRAAGRRLRRRTVRMAVAGVLLVALAIGAAGASTYLRLAATTLDPAEYAALRVGTPQEEVEPLLPWREYEYADDTSAAADRYDCRYYRSGTGLPTGDYSIYRLCFGGGELVSKESLPELGPYPDAEA
ncbi:two-component sensor histidine kinase [Streptomonospora sp. PA3]|uniref:sensor histidine kinase n=1 Tax=Streptomonospora sp. PA3 TaxID=2607326 RepID=UPI0012DDBA26|nr:histidine kinase [Streptomonospora sp. PA3]MUL42943.1 two-component sensor histidine kinase [Streptomonospora sp. PA3]